MPPTTEEIAAMPNVMNRPPKAAFNDIMIQLVIKFMICLLWKRGLSPPIGISD
jgi:hypothetical protein